MPSVFHYLSEEFRIVRNEDIFEMASSMSLVRHVHENLVSMPDKLSNADISLNLWERSVIGVDDMLSLKRCSILVESIRHKDRDEVEPGITRRSREKDPLISSTNS